MKDELEVAVLDADIVTLSGKVNDDTVIRANTLEVKLDEIPLADLDDLGMGMEEPAPTEV